MLSVPDDALPEPGRVVCVFLADALWTVLRSCVSWLRFIQII
jgi:hypothetical protein